MSIMFYFQKLKRLQAQSVITKKTVTTTTLSLKFHIVFI